MNGFKPTNSGNNVGISAMEVYFPSTYVKQEELEKANGVSSGKYTVGLGQQAMAFTGDHEDINSICLTVVHSLLEKYNISPKDIGRLEVGTETFVDKSKSTKTLLMSLFEESGNTDVEGATVVNACYGGTAAVLSAANWVDSSSWDGRYALVVAADIAVYTEGAARPTGGCGAIAMLIGRNAAIPLDLAGRTTHAANVWDFFKPNLDSEYPEVNGALSNVCYMQAIDDCYTRYVKKQKDVHNIISQVQANDYYLFHSPYNKLVQKSFARLLFLDMKLGNLKPEPGMEKFLSLPLEQTYDDKNLEKSLKDITGKLFDEKVSEGGSIAQQIGNSYTASVWINLANLVSIHGSKLADKSIVLFSYGSGALASMIKFTPVKTSDPKFNLDKMQKALDLQNRLNSRTEQSPAELSNALIAREKATAVSFTPTYSPANLFPGTYYLSGINNIYERNYARKPLAVRSFSTFTGRKFSSSSNVSSSRLGVQLARVLKYF